eukprot:485188-Prorocentrum_minimum.AAC.2
MWMLRAIMWMLRAIMWMLRVIMWMLRAIMWMLRAIMWMLRALRRSHRKGSHSSERRAPPEDTKAKAGSKIGEMTIPIAAGERIYP